MAPSDISIDRFIGVELDEYRIERVIGRGGMGVVYLAKDDLGQPVALKLMVPDLANNEQFRERFIREAQAAIDHPNVVQVYEAGEVDGVLYMAMEYIEGSDLKAIIEREGRLLPARAVSIFSQAASALDAAHEKGIVHRDVKPQNILVKPPGEGENEEHVYLSDFGLVKRTAAESSITGSTYLMGTIQYMSPEQIEGKTIDGRADVYSLGCVLYQSLTACVPFERDSDISLMWAHANEPPPSVTGKVPVLPAAVDAVVAKAMAKSPDDRYLTCGEFIGTLASELGVGSANEAKSVWSSGGLALSSSGRRRRPISGTTSRPKTPGVVTQPPSRRLFALGLATVALLGGMVFGRRQVGQALGEAADTVGGVAEAAGEIFTSDEPSDQRAAIDKEAKRDDRKSRRAIAPRARTTKQAADEELSIPPAPVAGGGLPGGRASDRAAGAAPATAKIVWVAAQSGSINDSDIWVMNADGSNKRRLTDTAADEHYPVWSPDGRKILFVRSGDLWVMDRDGRNQHSLGLCRRTTCADPGWSPNGRRIAFIVDGSAVYKADADGSNAQLLRRVPGAHSPSWSPSGRTIVLGCSPPQYNSEICLMNQDGTGYRRITNFERPAENPAWSPDGRTIAFQRNTCAAQCFAIWEMNPDGSGLRQLTEPTYVGAFDPSWARDGSGIAFVTLQTNASLEISTMAPDGTAASRLTDTTDVSDIMPDWWTPAS